MYKWLGGGMDKGYYYESNAAMGWLEFNDEAVKVRELTAYGKLQPSLKDYLPAIDQEKSPPDKLVNQKDQKIDPQEGYWVQHVPHQKTIKPKMMVFQVIPPTDKIVKGLGPQLRKELKSSLETIKTNLALISQQSGEISIAIHEITGRAYLLDYAPNESGNVGGEDLQEKAGKGIDKILALLTSLEE